ANGTPNGAVVTIFPLATVNGLGTLELLGNNTLSTTGNLSTNTVQYHNNPNKVTSRNYGANLEIRIDSAANNVNSTFTIQTSPAPVAFVVGQSLTIASNGNNRVTF